MAPQERRYTAAEWAQIHAEYRAQMARDVRTMHPDPKEECELGPFVPTDPSHPRRTTIDYRPPPHLMEWFATLSKDDVSHLQKLIDLKPATVEWIAEKNDRELKSLDGAVEFITSSRTAAKVLAWCFAAAVSIVGGAVALAKSGYDLFSLFRGGPQ